MYDDHVIVPETSEGRQVMHNLLPKYTSKCDLVVNTKEHKDSGCPKDSGFPKGERY